MRRRLPRRLLDWFARHRRDLPWRRDRDPYRIWVSEVMLQQTQAATVVPYFERFLQAFPTLADLAAADEQQVLRLWEGLGYYRRARDLLRTARLLAASHGGRFPDDPDALDGLPGLGRYTRNAVLSQAFDRRLPILEANSRRVLARLFGRTGDPARGPEQRWLWAAAEATAAGAAGRRLQPGADGTRRPGLHAGRAALPRVPAGRRLRRPPPWAVRTSIPARTPPPEIVERAEAAVVVRRGGRVLLAAAADQGPLGLAVGVPARAAGDGRSRPTRRPRRLLPELTGLRARLGPELLTLRHGVTRFRITLVCFEAEYLSGDFRSAFYSRRPG